MSEQENNDTPPKAKIGSLKDRIAAFEKSAQSDNISTQKSFAPRPKAAPVSWKPSPPSPKDDGDDKISERKRSGMSAEDAKESIAAGGGLKARMAALQGNMGSVGGAPPATTSPPIPKPMRKPFVPRPRTPDENEEEGSGDKPKEPLIIPHRRLDNWDPLAATAAAAATRQRSSSPPTEAESGIGEPEAATEEQPQEEQDEETKERERRAALAARMARLGGARIGMAPPIVSKKPKPAVSAEVESPPTANTSQYAPIRVLPIPGGHVEERVKTPEEVRETGSDTLRTITADDEASSRAAPLPPTSPGMETPMSPGEMSDKRSSSMHEDPTSSQTSLVSSRSTPSSIPLPAMPRRAAPPRSKHSSRSLKSEQSNQELDHPETGIAEHVPEVEEEAEAGPLADQVTEGVQNMSVVDSTAHQDDEAHLSADHEEDLTEEPVASPYAPEETAEEEDEHHIGDAQNDEGTEDAHNVEEHTEVIETGEEETIDDEKAEENKSAEEDEDPTYHLHDDIPQEEEEEEIPPPPPPRRQQSSHSAIPQEEEEEETPPPPPPPRRQQSSHSAMSSSKASDVSPSVNTVSPKGDKRFFHDAADELEDS